LGDSARTDGFEESWNDIISLQKGSELSVMNAIPACLSFCL
jgi:hypothetical protein